ncbi:hypothetical protein B0H10DRAFT_648400 [Mycena sp. CBHHK59/15]|nr:hypothetical protein B0H10DRAFT_648400 [Mycena sp. CBHHK59/15]
MALPSICPADPTASTSAHLCCATRTQLLALLCGAVRLTGPHTQKSSSIMPAHTVSANTWYASPARASICSFACCTASTRASPARRLCRTHSASMRAARGLAGWAACSRA